MALILLVSDNKLINKSDIERSHVTIHLTSEIVKSCDQFFHKDLTWYLLRWKLYSLIYSSVIEVFTSIFKLLHFNILSHYNDVECHKYITILWKLKKVQREDFLFWMTQPNQKRKTKLKAIIESIL